MNKLAFENKLTYCLCANIFGSLFAARFPSSNFAIKTYKYLFTQNKEEKKKNLILRGKKFSYFANESSAHWARLVFFIKNPVKKRERVFFP
jgi:hypothetical protein